jgi:hypothetical protein
MMHLFSGNIINPFDIRPEDIHIEDIAHALSLMNRFAGHTKRPISVAQHSVYVSGLVDGTGHELQALVHDGSEAYIADLVKWVKETEPLAGYRELEEKVQRAVYMRFNCPLEMAPEVELADRIMVRWEGMQGYGEHFAIPHPNYPPLTEAEIKSIGPWSFWSWQQSKEAFLTRARCLGVLNYVA